MEPISNADRLVQLLRQKLAERAKVGTNRAADAPRTGAATAPDPASGVRALAALEGGDERALRRAVIQNLLADQLGPELLNDAQFQQVVNLVTETIEEDSEARGLLNEVVAALRRP